MPDRKMKPSPKARLQGQSLRTNEWLKWIFVALFVLAALGGMIWMASLDTGEPKLLCNTNEPHGITGFGTCRAEAP